MLCVITNSPLPSALRSAGRGPLQTLPRKNSRGCGPVCSSLLGEPFSTFDFTASVSDSSIRNDFRPIMGRRRRA